MKREQKNTKYWPKVLWAEITTTDITIPARWILAGKDIDAQALCPKRAYVYRAGLIRAAEKLGWVLQV